ncbi:dynactin subunit 6 [Microplitis demolitor]|uniref:dynactin subunit 6 n=1 Tax=Microplitis demolitor TaxID=69319 RepID=UPI0004CD1ED5|nr:dynactin subunit 6 [Microplitis demolitor]XP_008557284.1 dynactin subunit 6 [Microplitis demolitor]
MSTPSSTRRLNVKIAAGAIVCDESILKGDITIGPRTIVHPRASILAEDGPIVIGEGNIIEEMATIMNRSPPDSETESPVQMIGSFNVFETDSMCEALKVGDNNVFESKAKVSRDVEVTSGCVVGTSCSLIEPEIVPENTIIYGTECHRREMNDKPYPQVGQLEFLVRILPNYHHLRKPNMKIVKADPQN